MRGLTDTQLLVSAQRRDISKAIKDPRGKTLWMEVLAPLASDQKSISLSLSLSLFLSVSLALWVRIATAGPLLPP